LKNSGMNTKPFFIHCSGLISRNTSFINRYCLFGVLTYSFNVSFPHVLGLFSS
jgi:hypothetical protein